MIHSEMRQKLRNFCKQKRECDICFIDSICDRRGKIDSFCEGKKTDDEIEYLYKTLAIEIACANAGCATCEIYKARIDAGESCIDCAFDELSKRRLFELFDLLADRGILDAIDEDSFDVDRVDDSAIDILFGE